MKKLMLFILWVLLTSAPISAQECSENFSWKPSADESSVIGYHIWYGSMTGFYTTIVDIGKPEIQPDGRVHGKVTGLECGKPYYFVCTAYTDNAESLHSNEVYVESVGRPKAPQDFKHKQ